MAKRHLYLRDYTKQNKHPVGCVAVEVDEATNEIRYAFSACSPFDRWNSIEARNKANGRLIQNPAVIRGEVPKSNHDIMQRVMEHLVKANSVQAKDKSRSYLAFEAAKGWLSEAAKNKTETRAS